MGRPSGIGPGALALKGASKLGFSPNLGGVTATFLSAVGILNSLRGIYSLYLQRVPKLKMPIFHLVLNYGG